MDPHAGIEIVPGYRLTRRAATDGAGGFGLGSLWEAVRPDGTTSAIKFATSEHLGAVQRKERYIHPCLVSLHGYWLRDLRNGEVLPDSNEGSNQCELIVALGAELLGPSLGDRLRHNPDGLSAEEVLRYLRSVAEAVDFLNGPCDQRLESLLGCGLSIYDVLVSGGHGTLRDVFFWNRPNGDFSHCSDYAAPELGTLVAARTSDQYSLAVIYFEARTGRLPFKHPPNSSFAQRLMIRLTEPPDLDSLPDAECKVLSRALSLEPESRYSSCIEMIAALSDCV